MAPDKLTPAANNAPMIKAAPPSAPAVQQAAAKPSAVSLSASALIAAAGLPTDKLSAAIVSFARFFSLPLKPELLAAIRRQALPPSTAGQSEKTENFTISGSNTVKGFSVPGSDTMTKGREALALAAAAAESKGVELSPKGLDGFGEAIDPDRQRRQERGRRGQPDKNDTEPENAPKTGPITAAGLKKMALETAEKDSLLDILNRLPGKNGQRWVVLPFSFCEEGRKFNVSLKILFETDRLAGLMAMDIVESGENERSWLFVLDSRGLTNKLAVYLQPELPENLRFGLGGELSRLMEIPPGHISIRSRTESFPCESGYGDDTLRSIDEAV